MLRRTRDKMLPAGFRVGLDAVAAILFGFSASGFSGKVNGSSHSSEAVQLGHAGLAVSIVLA
jgi:hypothetical protein